MLVNRRINKGLLFDASSKADFKKLLLLVLYRLIFRDCSES